MWPARSQGRRVPVVVTCRPTWEGGRFDGQRRRAGAASCAQALELGAEFVDVEWRAVEQSMAPDFGDLVRRDPARVVVSSHDFDGVPADLDDRVPRDAGAGRRRDQGRGDRRRA